MLKILPVFALALFLFPMQAHGQTSDAQQASQDDKPSSPVTPAVHEQSDSPSLQPEHQKHVQADVRVVSTPEKDGYDIAAFWVSVALLGVGIFGVIYAKRTLDKLHHHATQFESLAASAGNNAAAAKDAATAAKEMLELSRITAQRQLRAYVCLDTAEIAFDGGQPIAYVNFRNSGQTPAYEAHGWAGVEAASHPFPAPLPIPVNIAKAKYTVGPGAKFGFPGRRKTPLFTQAELESFAKPDKTLYVYGRVDYRDAFGDWWYTNFRLIAGGKAGLRIVKKEDGSVRWMLGPDFEGNDAT